MKHNNPMLAALRMARRENRYLRHRISQEIEFHRETIARVLQHQQSTVNGYRRFGLKGKA